MITTMVNGSIPRLITEQLSRLSDRISGPVAEFGARKLAPKLRAPAHFVELLFLIEDKRFVLHVGIDPAAIARALIFNARRGMLQGASTIPQQLYALGSHPRTMRFKIDQCLWAICQSFTATKLDILKRYLNAVYWGRSYYGLDSATKGYFQTNRESISAAQSFFLAERIACPNRASPARIANLLKRPPIGHTLRRCDVEKQEIMELYNRYYGCGGEIWRLLEK